MNFFILYYFNLRGGVLELDYVYLFIVVVLAVFVMSLILVNIAHSTRYVLF